MLHSHEGRSWSMREMMMSAVATTMIRLFYLITPLHQCDVVHLYFSDPRIPSKIIVDSCNMISLQWGSEHNFQQMRFAHWLSSFSIGMRVDAMWMSDKAQYYIMSSSNPRVTLTTIPGHAGHEKDVWSLWYSIRKDSASHIYLKVHIYNKKLIRQ